MFMQLYIGFFLSREDLKNFQKEMEQFYIIKRASLETSPIFFNKKTEYPNYFLLKL